MISSATFIAAIFCLLGLVGLLLIILVVDYIFDYRKNAGWRGKGTVIGRYFTPAHTDTNTTWITANGVMTPIVTTQDYDDEWTLVLQDDDGEQHKVPVTHEVYSNIPDGEAYTRS